MDELDALEMRVTAEVFAAEKHSPGTIESRRAYAILSATEEQIARLVDPNHPSGKIARRGAVSAAHMAGDPDRAKRLSEEFGVAYEEDPWAEVYGRTTDAIVDYLQGLATQYLDGDLSAMLKDATKEPSRCGLHDDVRHALHLLVEYIDRQER